MAGASPDVMAATVATPLERHLGQIADVTEMTSSSSTGATRITLQFGLDRDIDGAARDVEAAINAARADLPTALRSNPTYRKVNPADAPILILALTSKTLTAGQLYDAADTILAQKLSQVSGIGQVTIGGSSLPAVRVELNPSALFKYGIGLEDVRAALAAANANTPQGLDRCRRPALPDLHQRPGEQGGRIPQPGHRLPQRRGGAALGRRRGRSTRSRTCAISGSPTASPRCSSILYRQPGANIIDTVDRVTALHPGAQGLDPDRHRHPGGDATAPPPSAPRSATWSARC